MRRITRFERSIDQLLDIGIVSRPRSSVCLACRRRTLAASPRATFSTSRVQRESEDDKVPFTQRLRRKIWGTSEPVGQEDPYQRLSPEETKAEQAASQAAEQEAKQEAKRKEFEENYEPATTWDGLESVGGYGGWWRDVWDPKHTFHGFLGGVTMTDKYDLTAALHRAVVEVLLLRDEGRPLSDATNARDDRLISQTTRVQITKGLDINHNGHQNFMLDFPKDEGVSEAILQTMVPSKPVKEVMNVDDAMEESESSSTSGTVPTNLSGEARPEINGGNQEWFQVSLEKDEQVKFAVVKRVMQLTGIHIPDVKIQAITTIQSLLQALVKPPKPKKLVDALAADDRLAGLQNVKLFDRRITPIDREKTVGRWKVIERELERRELPVTGRP